MWWVDILVVEADVAWLGRLAAIEDPVVLAAVASLAHADDDEGNADGVRIVARPTLLAPAGATAEVATREAGPDGDAWTFEAVLPPTDDPEAPMAFTVTSTTAAGVVDTWSGDVGQAPLETPIPFASDLVVFAVLSDGDALPLDRNHAIDAALGKRRGTGPAARARAIESLLARDAR
jgi:hypothetical protein